jgi:hypothetical protein
MKKRRVERREREAAVLMLCVGGSFVFFLQFGRSVLKALPEPLSNKQFISSDMEKGGKTKSHEKFTIHDRIYFVFNLCNR